MLMPPPELGLGHAILLEGAPAQTIGHPGEGSCRLQSRQLPINNKNHSDREERGDQTGTGLWEPGERRAAPFSSKGVGTSFGEFAAAKSRLLPPWNSGYQDACLQSWPASQQPGAAGCNYALQLQRKLLAAGACAGPGCTLAAGLKGTMQIETSGSRGRGGAGRG